MTDSRYREVFFEHIEFRAEAAVMKILKNRFEILYETFGNNGDRRSQIQCEIRNQAILPDRLHIDMILWFHSYKELEY